MNVASLELCKELYELYGWEDTYLRWVNFKEPRVVNADEWAKNMEGEPDLVASGDSVYVDETVLTPAYDLGYLWRKLEDMGNEIAVGYSDSGSYYHLRYGGRGTGNMMEGFGWVYHCEPADIEDSLCEFFIELFRQGTLKKVGGDEG